MMGIVGNAEEGLTVRRDGQKVEGLSVHQMKARHLPVFGVMFILTCL